MASEESLDKYMARGEFDICLNKGHATRPAVQWLVWCNKHNE